MKLSISKKFAKRSIKCLALFAPIAYLFGSLFFGLNGSHGAFPFAEPVYAEVQEYVQTNFLQEGESYRLDIDSPDFPIVYPSASIFDWQYTYLGTDFVSIRNGSSGRSLIGVDSDSNEVSFILIGVFAVPTPLQLFFSELPPFVLDFNYCSLYVLKNIQVPSDVVPENSGANSDYVFKQFFAKDNFLVQWGENCISENPVGFAPFGSFFKLLDDNIFHLSDSQIGLMAYGYLYYCLHVLIACLAFDIVAFIPLFVQRVQDKLGGKEDD